MDWDQIKTTANEIVKSEVLLTQLPARLDAALIRKRLWTVVVLICPTTWVRVRWHWASVEVTRLRASIEAERAWLHGLREALGLWTCTRCGTLYDRTSGACPCIPLSMRAHP